MSSVIVEISNTFERKMRLPRRKTLSFLRGLPFEELATKALPRGYQLSLVICGDKLAQTMNATYRKKTYRPNVLSFPLSKTEGEIFLNIRKAEREALPAGRQDAQLTTSEKRAVRDRIARLFVHGCVHLAGHDHGAPMDRLETSILKSFKYRDIPEA